MQIEMPVPQPEHKKLEALTGTWTGEEKMHPSPWDPQGGPATSRTEGRVALGGFFVITNYTQHRNGQLSYEGHGVYGWDPAKRAFLMWWFDSIGSIPPGPARGVWEGNTLTFSSTSPMGHQRYVYTFEGHDRQRFRLEQSQDGKQWTLFMEGTYRRR
jgi:hypothetical protein